MQQAPWSLLHGCPSLARTATSVTVIIIIPMLSPSGVPLQMAKSTLGYYSDYTAGQVLFCGFNSK